MPTTSSSETGNIARLPPSLARENEQRRDQSLGTESGVSNAAERRRNRLVVHVGQQELDLVSDDRERAAQLVGDLRGEATLATKDSSRRASMASVSASCFSVVGTRERDAIREVARRGKARPGGNQSERAQHAPGRPSTR